MFQERRSEKLSLSRLEPRADGRSWKRWRDAAEARHSVRTFLQNPPEETVLRELRELTRRLQSRAGRVEVIPSLEVDIFTGLVGGYGKVGPSPAALLFIENGVGSWGPAGIGYLGEVAVLEATRLGLGTCWVGGFFDPARAAHLVELADHERIAAVSPLGLAARRPGLGDRALKAIARSHKRKAAEELATEGYEDWPEWARAAVALARLAPSAVNRQPWRFAMDEEGGERLVVRLDEPNDKYRVPKRLDCGIAMTHVEVAVRAAGRQGYWQQRVGQEVAAFVVD